MSDKKSEETPKWGAGSLQAAGRMGLAEVRSVLYPGVGVPTDVGMYGMATQREVHEQKLEDVQPAPDKPDSVLGERIEQAQQMAEASRGAKDKDRSPLEKE